MDHKPFTVRNVSKFIVTSIVASKVTDVAEDVITDHTRFEEEDLTVYLGSRIVGWYVASAVRPVTDKIVDKTADFVTAKREARKAKKNTTKQD